MCNPLYATTLVRYTNGIIITIPYQLMLLTNFFPFCFQFFIILGACRIYVGLYNKMSFIFLHLNIYLITKNIGNMISLVSLVINSTIGDFCLSHITTNIQYPMALEAFIMTLASTMVDFYVDGIAGERGRSSSQIL